MYILLSDNTFEIFNEVTAQTMGACGTADPADDLDAVYVFEVTCTTAISGRHVVLYQTESASLHTLEVEVYLSKFANCYTVLAWQ